MTGRRDAAAERFDHFMARANAAYYANCDPFADFTTAPEISQVFGELLGGWARVVHGMMGAPADVMLVEAGPGRGTLMADALRVWPNAGSVHFIETSARLRALQAAKVPGAVWHDGLETLPARPFILLANEFLDALPVRQFVCREAGWMERHVCNGAYVERPADCAGLPAAAAGTVREVGEAAAGFVRDVAARGGVGLFIDYGPERSAAGSSVQAISGGRPADPLAAPGAADVTAHVDFEALGAAARAVGAAVQGPVTQSRFLTALGLFQRTDALAQARPDRALALRAAARRLTAPEAMGSLFKAMAVAPAGMAALPGFEPWMS
jgi:SAM-dependent MidA family methyltransferase